MNFNEEARFAFIKYAAAMGTYVQQIVVDEIWNHTTTGFAKNFNYVRDYSIFMECLDKCYKNNISEMTNDLDSLTLGISNIMEESMPFVENVKNELYENNNFGDILRTTTTDIPEGKYLYVDLKNAGFQAVSYCNNLLKGKIEKAFNKYKGSDYFKKLKGAINNGYNYNSYFSKDLPFVFEIMLYIAIKNDKKLSEYISKNTYGPTGIVGDNIIFKLKDGIDESIIDYNHTFENGIMAHISFQERKIHNIGNLLIYEALDIKQEPIFFIKGTIYPKIPTEIYPQIYKNINGLEIQHEDLAYGYGDKFSYFTKKIWEY